jgi:hypothetical protein
VAPSGSTSGGGRVSHWSRKDQEIVDFKRAAKSDKDMLDLLGVVAHMVEKLNIW